MKTLMLGNEAAARGLFEAGCSFVSSYPGTPSTEITECAAKYPEIYAEWAPNEKVAMEAAFGASLSGRRSFCGMKHVGLNVAADPLFTLSYTGVRGGMVIGVADDAGMHSSQNEQDSRHYAIAAKLPMLEPSDAAESLAFAKLAYELSEKFDTPVLLKMCTRVAHAQSVVETSERQEVAPIPYEKDIAKFVMMPACARARHPIVEQRTLALQAWAETADVNRVEDGADHSIGLISSSTSYQYVKEVCGDKYPVLKLGMIHPLPVEKIRAFAKSVEKVIVVEELDGIIEAHCRSIGVTNVTGKELFGCIGEFSQNYIAEKLGMAVRTGHKLDESIPARPPVMCAGCPHRGLVLYAQEEQADRPRRYRLLYAGRCCAARRDRHRRSAWARPSPAYTASTRPPARKTRTIPSPSSAIRRSCIPASQASSTLPITSRPRPSSSSITPSPA